MLLHSSGRKEHCLALTLGHLALNPFPKILSFKTSNAIRQKAHLLCAKGGWQPGIRGKTTDPESERQHLDLADRTEQGWLFFFFFFLNPHLEGGRQTDLSPVIWLFQKVSVCVKDTTGCFKRPVEEQTLENNARTLPFPKPREKDQKYRKPKKGKDRQKSPERRKEKESLFSYKRKE